MSFLQAPSVSVFHLSLPKWEDNGSSLVHLIFSSFFMFYFPTCLLDWFSGALGNWEYLELILIHLFPQSPPLKVVNGSRPTFIFRSTKLLFCGYTDIADNNGC